jgi:methylated-DNA-[protein]-cysteine S-methyltransferase
MSVRYTVIDSPVGPLTLAGDDALTHLRMNDQQYPPNGRDEWVRDDRAFPDVVEQLRAYFAGRLTEFDVNLRLEGPTFHRRVWEALLEIPHGETASYGQVATRIGYPVTASRAVGWANGHNPVAIIVPCHRVIGANGALVGYGGGLDRKRLLLDLERDQRQPRLAGIG